MKDPNKPILRLYDIPDTTFESEEESGESEEGEELCELSGIIGQSVLVSVSGFIMGRNHRIESPFQRP